MVLIRARLRILWLLGLRGSPLALYYPNMGKGPKKTGLRVDQH